MRGDLATTKQVLFKCAGDREGLFVRLSSEKGCRVVTHYTDLKICFEDKPSKFHLWGK